MDVVLFQYITCYSLSAAGKTQAKMFPGFNTSHVTLYRKSVFVKTQEEYCFNTSHVTLYRLVIMDGDDVEKGFNTSHVTLYRKLF